MKRSELIAAIDAAEARIAAMVGRWSDHIPAPVREELHEIGTPLLRILLRLGRRG